MGETCKRVREGDKQLQTYSTESGKAQQGRVEDQRVKQRNSVKTLILLHRITGGFYTNEACT